MDEAQPGSEDWQRCQGLEEQSRRALRETIALMGMHQDLLIAANQLSVQLRDEPTVKSITATEGCLIVHTSHSDDAPSIPSHFLGFPVYTRVS